MSELSDRIRSTIESEDVVLFMKGTPEQVLCGNSARALDALRSVGASVTAVDVLPDPAIRQELSALSSWPTIPQVFVRGELVGGADIVEELAGTGELRAKLDASLGDGWPNGDRTERVVEVTDGESRLRLVP
jgi:monothiol glutaredoxin